MKINEKEAADDSFKTTAQENLLNAEMQKMQPKNNNQPMQFLQKSLFYYFDTTLVAFCGLQWSWTLIQANSKQVSNMQSFDHNR